MVSDLQSNLILSNKGCYRNIMNKLKRRRMAKQPLALPLISPSLTKYMISQTIDTALINQKHKERLSRNQYIDIFRKFEEDFNQNRLSQQFDKALEESIKDKTLEDIPETELIKSLSKSIKVKLFQGYLNKNKNKKHYSSEKHTEKQKHRYDKTGEDTNLKQKKQTLAVERRYSFQRIFSVSNTSIQNQESRSNSKTKNLYKKFNNKKLYYQMISPFYICK